MFDLATYGVVGKLKAMPDADGIIYDAALNRIFAVSGDAMPFSHSRQTSIQRRERLILLSHLGGSPEFLASDGSGKVYVNLQDKDVVAEVDIEAGKVLARWPVAPGGAPVGLSIDPDHRLFIGCRNRKSWSS